MKKLDWKSFAIGILVTTTVVFGVAATNPNQQKQWDENQIWLTKIVPIPAAALTEEYLKQIRSGLIGWEFVDVKGTDLIYRRPVNEWPELPPYRKPEKDNVDEITGLVIPAARSTYSLADDLNYILP